ncbi:MAG: exo-alpha-sialidase [Clostridia bacterium]|nr:exo-alpha-sialidase [Clostridia bacterium]
MYQTTIVPIGEPIEAIDMHGVKHSPFIPFAIRCPQFCELADGTLLFFFEAKYQSQLDEEPACHVLLRSGDGGKTWGDARMLCYDDFNIGGVPVYDRIHNTLLYYARTREWKPEFAADRLLTEQDQVDGKVLERFWVAKSRDGGLSWSDYREVFIDAPEAWRVKHCPTPGMGIQLQNQPDPQKNGRIIIPSNHIGANLGGKNEFGSHLVYSDDFGESWKLGAIQDYPGGNECNALELADGTILLNARTHASIPANRRLQSESQDGGDSFCRVYPVESLYCPGCHGGFARLPLDGTETIFFTAPTGETGDPFNCLGVPGYWGRREKLMLYASTDAGRTYSPIRLMSPPGEFAAYSALFGTSDGKLLCAWESGPEIGLYRSIEYVILEGSELSALLL